MATTKIQSGDLNPNVATALDTFTVSAKGVVPAPGSATGKLLRDDATWVTVGGTGTVTSVGVSNTGGGLTVTASPVTAAGTINIDLDGDLAAIAALAGTSGLLRKTAANTWSLDTSTFLTANQTVTLSGDATGSGATAITVSIASFAGSTKGLVPVSVGGTTNFLRADGSWAAPGGGGSPGGSTTQVQYNSAGTFAGATNVTIQSNDLATAVVASPAAASAGTAKLTAGNIAGRIMHKSTGPSGWSTELQPFRGRHQMTGWFPAGNSTTVELMAAQALSATGTATQAVVATTNIHTKMKRLDYLVTVAAANAVAGWRYAPTTASGQHWIDGGFHYVCRFGPGTGQTTATTRSFTGLAVSNAAPTDVEPSTLVSCIGVGWDAADANIQIMHNDAAGACTKVDLGGSFVVPAVDRTVVYELALFCAPGATSVEYLFTNIGTGATASGTLSTNLPSTTGLLLPRSWMSVGGTSSVIGITLMSCYIESAF